MWVVVAALGMGMALPATHAQSLPVQPPRLMAVSADGEALTWVEPGARGDQIMVKPLSRRSSKKTLLWRANGRIDGIENLGRHLLVRTRHSGWVRWYEVHWPGGGQKLLLSERVSAREGPRVLQVLDHQQVMFSNDQRQPWQPDVMILGSAGQSRIEQGGQNIFRWHPAPDGRLLLARRWRFDANGPLYEWLWRPSREKPWTVVRERRLSEPRWELGGFDLASNLAVFRPEDRKSLLSLNLSNGALLTLPKGHLPSTAKASIWEMDQRHTIPELRAVTETNDWAAIDPESAGRTRHWLGQTGLDAVWQIGPDALGLKVLRVGQSTVETIPGIAMDAGAPVTTHRVPTSDGRLMEVLLTLPTGPQAPENRAMVLLIHGGPWSHDEPGWNPEAQWLASLGYSVLQANFRGSTNAGFSWQWAGRQQWSGKMLEDLEDALSWARQEQIAGAEQVCAMGSSFGGFAALMLAARAKSQLRCVVARSPVTDLAQQIAYLNRIGNSRGFQEWREMVGDPLTQDLLASSPLGNATRIQDPVLMGHGQYDDVVQVKQSQRLVERLQAAGGGSVQWIQLMGQGHDLRGAAARRQWYTQVAHFLDQARQSGG